MDELPLVLLGLCLAWRDGADTTPVEFLYGTPLRLPGQFIPGAEDNLLEALDAFSRMFF